MSTAPTIDRVPDATEQRRFRWLLWSFLVLVLAGAGIALWLLVADDTQATITFDGTDAVYSGPSQLEAYPNQQTFRLVNKSNQTVDFHYTPVKEEALAAGLTEEEARAWPADDQRMPPFLGNPGRIARVPSGETVEGNATFIAGRTYQLDIWDLVYERAHWVAWIEVSE